MTKINWQNKEEVREYKREWRGEHKEEIREYDEKRNKTPERKAYMKKYNIEHKEGVKEYNKKYRLKHKKEKKAGNMKYYQEHKEQRKQYRLLPKNKMMQNILQTEYAKKNPEKIKTQTYANNNKKIHNGQ